MGGGVRVPAFWQGRLLVGASGLLLAISPALKWYTVFGLPEDGGGDATPLVDSARGFEALPAISTILLLVSLGSVGVALASGAASNRRIPNVPAPALAIGAALAVLVLLLVGGSLINAPAVRDNYSFAVDYRAEGAHTPGIYLALLATLGLGVGYFVMWQRALAHGSTEQPVFPSLNLGPAGRKRCPDCAESVLAEARVCKHCGYRFPDANPGVDAPDA